MKYKCKATFPCGYSFELEAKARIINLEDGHLPVICPLHGKKCKRLK